MRVRNNPELPSILQQRFTNREDHIAVFLQQMDSVSSPLPVLMFYGMGGIGKSWLLRRLRGELTGRYAVPSALIDFTLEQGSNPYGSDPLLFLAELRRISEAPCPRFDLALTVALVRRYRLDESALADKWKTTGVAAGWEAIKATGGIIHPVLGGALSVLEKGYGAIQDRAFLNAVREKFLAGLEGIRHLDLYEIEKQLTWRLSQDLRDESVLPLRQGHRSVRAVVFIDTVESLLPAGISESDEERQSYGLRELIAELRDRVLFVLAGQNRLDWSFLDSEWEDPQCLEQHHLEGLAERDAREFLNRCDLGAVEVQDAILEKCLQVENGTSFHAASLGLFADIGWIEKNRSGREPTPTLYAEVDPHDMASLVRRFLKSLPSEAEQQWIRRLAVTPSFDEAAARAMHSDGWSQAQDTAVEMLKGLSFLEPDSIRSGWFSIHSAVQDALWLSGRVDEAWHRRWREYWESRGAEGLAWFHFWSLDREGARVAWDEETNRARSALEMARHAAMLDWWRPTGVELRTPRDLWDGLALNSLATELCEASLGNRGINLRRAISCYELALKVRTRSEWPEEWARTHNNLGNVYQSLPDGDRSMNLRIAISSYGLALEVWTPNTHPVDCALILNNRGNAYQILPDGDQTSNLLTAISDYRQTLEVITREEFPIDWARTQNNLGSTYVKLHDFRSAISCHKLALEVFMLHPPSADFAMASHNLGLALLRLSESNTDSTLQDAVAYFELALQIYTREAFPADWAKAQCTIALAMEKQAEIDSARRQTHLSDAAHRLREALGVFSQSGHEHFIAITHEILLRVEEKLA